MGKKFDWLIVGLGNPGKEYSGNRHNIGWMVVDALCKKYGKKPSRLPLTYYKAEIEINSQKLLVCKPATFMNRSGDIVGVLKRKHDIPVERIVIISDEYNFPVGKIHLRLGGSDGGHNGVSSVIYELESNKFVRLRCGIGKKFPQGGMVKYVLSDFLEEDIPMRDIMIQKAVSALEYLVENGIEKAMTDINSGKI